MLFNNADETESKRSVGGNESSDAGDTYGDFYLFFAGLSHLAKCTRLVIDNAEQLHRSIWKGTQLCRTLQIRLKA